MYINKPGTYISLVCLEIRCDRSYVDIKHVRLLEVSEEEADFIIPATV
jgi:hypothetical protein